MQEKKQAYKKTLRIAHSHINKEFMSIYIERPKSTETHKQYTNIMGNGNTD